MRRRSWPGLRRLVVWMMLGWSAATLAPAIAADDAAAQPMRIVGYVSDRDPLPAIDASKLDALNFAFARVDPRHRVFLPHEATAARLRRIVELRRHNPRLKVLLSIGGWGAGNFSEAAASPTARRRFARTAVALLQRFDLDGLDIDWEYPAHPGPGISHRPEDRDTFPLLLQAVRRALDREAGRSGRHYLLTIAAADGEGARGLDIERIVPLLDWINLMTYDFYGSQSTHTGHHAGLHRAASAAPGSRNTEQAVDEFLAAGVPARKLHVGAAFYGKIFTDVEPANSGLSQPYRGDVEFVAWHRIRNEFLADAGFERHWDDTAQAAWLWDASARRMVSYEDPQALRAKVRFAKARGLGGVMYWEHDQDDGEMLLDIVRETLVEP